MSELIDALNQLQKEKHIEKEVIMQAIEDSLVAACNRDFGQNAIVKVNMDRDTGDISVSFNLLMYSLNPLYYLLYHSMSFL